MIGKTKWEKRIMSSEKCRRRKRFLIILKLFFIAFMVQATFCTGCQPDTTQIVQGQKILCEWIAPPDSDLAGFHIFFIGKDSDYTKLMNITKWWIRSDSLLKSQTVIDDIVALPIGNDFAYITAYDLAGNESEPSDTVYYKIVNPSPGKVYNFIIKVLR